MTISKVGDPSGWDIGVLVEAVGLLDDTRRRAALAVFAHHLTVEIRVALDEPMPHPGLDRIRQLNEFLHHLTSRLHPDERRSAEDDRSLLEAFSADAARVGVEKGLKRGLVIAVRNARLKSTRPVPAL
ncbi:MAG TPA: hypothetical protein VG308_15040 [Stellaceae bacterium]|jgi:hypothetical protein|nr:hypothetical protein [Stellaceae bacterium]